MVDFDKLTHFFEIFVIQLAVIVCALVWFFYESFLSDVEILRFFSWHIGRPSSEDELLPVKGVRLKLVRPLIFAIWLYLHLET